MIIHMLLLAHIHLAPRGNAAPLNEPGASACCTHAHACPHQDRAVHRKIDYMTHLGLRGPPCLTPCTVWQGTPAIALGLVYALLAAGTRCSMLGFAAPVVLRASAKPHFRVVSSRWGVLPTSLPVRRQRGVCAGTGPILGAKFAPVHANMGWGGQRFTTARRCLEAEQCPGEGIHKTDAGNQLDELSSELRDKVARALEQHCGVCRDAHLVVGVSGGADSIALLHILVEIRNLWRCDAGKELSIHVVHFNHGLRDESEEEETFVCALARELLVRVHVVTMPVERAAAFRSNPTGMQEFARGWRRREMARIALDLQACTRSLPLFHSPALPAHLI